MTEHGLLRYFRYEHLPPALQEISKPFCELARFLDSDEMSVGKVKDAAELTVALRKLLEAKDAAVRSVLP